MEINDGDCLERASFLIRVSQRYCHQHPGGDHSSPSFKFSFTRPLSRNAHRGPGDQGSRGSEFEFCEASISGLLKLEVNTTVLEEYLKARLNVKHLAPSIDLVLLALFQVCPPSCKKKLSSESHVTAAWDLVQFSLATQGSAAGDPTLEI